MRVILLLIVAFVMQVDLNGQIIINEVNIAGNWVELYNAGTTTVDISSYALCNRPRYRVVSATTSSGSNAGVELISGSLNIAPGEYTVLGWENISTHGMATGELGLYAQIGGYTNVSNIQDYIQWGTGTPGIGRDGTAVSAGIWDNTSSVVSAPTNSSNSLALVVGNYTGGTDSDSMDWEEREPTQGAVNNLQNQIIINELNIAGNWVELYNAGTTTIDITDYTLCNRPRYAEMSDAAVTLLSGSFIMAPGDFTVVQWSDISFHGVATGELGLYEVRGMYTSTSNIQDYLQWGMGSLFNNGGRDGTAQAAGVWDSTNSFLPVPTDPNNSLGLVVANYSGGTDTDSTDWEEQSPTQGAVNMSPSNCPIDQNITGVIPSDTYYASSNIMSDGIVSMTSSVMFVAGNEILLNEGFEVELSAFFEASIGSCP